MSAQGTDRDGQSWTMCLSLRIRCSLGVKACDQRAVIAQSKSSRPFELFAGLSTAWI
jgi:hypothetical protein